MTFSFSNLIELTVALGLINVWIFRSNLSTPFRGGESRNLKEEFRSYGLSDGVFMMVGTLKLVSATMLLAGLHFSFLTIPAAAVIAVLMLGAIAMHIKVRDSWIKSVPAVVMLSLSLFILALH